MLAATAERIDLEDAESSPLIHSSRRPHSKKLDSAFRHQNIFPRLVFAAFAAGSVFSIMTYGNRSVGTPTSGDSSQELIISADPNPYMSVYSTDLIASACTFIPRPDCDQQTK